MNKFFVGTIAATIIILIGGIFIVSSSQNTPNTPLPSPEGHEYFWGDGCPHCAKVAEFFDGSNVDEKITIDKKEVWNNTINATRMRERGRACSIPATEMGVPLLVKPDGTCVGGDQPIIDYFKSLEVPEE